MNEDHPRKEDDLNNEEDPKNGDDQKMEMKVLIFVGELTLHKVIPYTCGICRFTHFFVVAQEISSYVLFFVGDFLW